MAEFIPTSWHPGDTSPVERANAVGSEVYHAIRVELQAPDVLRPKPEDMKFGAQIQTAFGTSGEYQVDIYFETEESLKAALRVGLLLQLAEMSAQKIREKVEFSATAIIRVRYNSWEYVSKKGDGFHRSREGDWRADFEFTFDADERLISQPRTMV